MKVCILIAPLILLAGCVVQRVTPFDPSAYSPFAGTGSASITGQAFLKTNGGDVKFGAGNEILLTPVTPYTEEWYEKAYLQHQNLSPADPREAEYIKSATADGSGNFEFQNIPAGDYFVRCTITWMIDAYTSTGGIVCKRVHVEPGQAKKIILTS